MFYTSPRYRWPVLGVLLLTAVVSTTRTAADADVRDGKKTSQRRMELAKVAYQGLFERQKVDPSEPLDLDKLQSWSLRWMAAQRELADDKVGRVAAAEAHLKRIQALEDWCKSMVEEKQAPRYVAAMAEYHRLEAERLVGVESGK